MAQSIESGAMTVAELLDALRRVGARLSVDGERLRVDASPGVMTPALQAAVRASKAELIALLAGTAAKSVEPIPLTPRGRTDSLRASFSQEALWFVQSLTPQSSAYNLPGALELRGPLDLRALGAAFDSIVERHEILRTRFVAIDERPIQVVDVAPVRPALEIVDLTRSGDEGELRSRLASDASRVIDLERGPVLCARLYVVEPERHVLSFVAHHIASDGWSLAVFVRELGELYSSFAAGRPSQLPPLPLQYADYAAWQRTRLEGEGLERELRYWRKQLEGVPTRLEMPTDHARPPVFSHRGAQFGFTLSRHLQERLTALSRAENATLFMTLLAAFQLLLSRYSGQDDVVVGTPVANRSRPELEPLIGLFVNTLVLRTQLSADRAFLSLLASVREVCMQAYAHQDLPFEKLVEALRPERDASRNPLFQVMFGFQNVEMPSVDLGGLRVSPLALPRTTSQVDLTLFMRATGAGLEGTFEYATDLFDGATIGRLAGHFGRLLESIVASPRAALRDLKLLNETERSELIGRWNTTSRDYALERTVVDLWREQVQRRPEAIAVRFGHEQLTYAELERQSTRLARRLRTLGLAADELIAVCVERSPRMIVSLLAVLKAGAAYVPLDPQFPSQRLRYMLEDSGARTLITESALARDLAVDARVRQLCVDVEPAIDEEAINDLPALARPQQRAYVIYTSGSTGKPKGVQIEHRALTNFLSSMAESPGIGEDDILAAVTTVSFDIAALELFLPLVRGARIELVARDTALNAAALGELLAERDVTVLQATPATWKMLLDSGWGGKRNLKALCGGEALSADLAARLLPACAQLWNLYGPTETTIWSSLARIEDPADVTIGAPIANTQLYVLDAQLAPVPLGVVGELWIGGVGVARGYLGRPELTAERFVANPFDDGRMYRTGDLARRLRDGRLQCLGRVDQQVKIRGYRIEPGEIEVVLAGHADVRECAVVAREVRGDSRLIAYVVGSAAEQALRGHLRAQLPEYMIPAHFVAVEQLPRTPNLKIDRKALHVPDGLGVAAGVEYVPPQTATERTVAEIFERVLAVKPVGSHHNFFELGGHSLLIMKVVSEVRERCRVDLPLRAMFEAPTVRELGQYVDTVLWSTRKSPGRSVAEPDRVRITL